MKKKSKLKKFFISIAIILVVVIVVPLFVFTFQIKAEWFSEEQHAKRITRRIEKKIKSGYYDVTDFEVYPLYTLDEELRYFLVEFEPEGHAYILLTNAWTFGGMYKLASGRTYYWWNPCTIEETRKNKFVIFDRDENGSKIVTVQSPYRYRGKLNEKKYLLELYTTSLVPAVKSGNNFVNLYADYEFTVDGEGKITNETIELFNKTGKASIAFHGYYNFLY